MSVDLSKIQPGDEIAIRGWVAKITSSFVVVRWTATGVGSNLDTFTADAIVSHTRRPVEAGDRVRNTRCAAYPPAYVGGEVLAIAGEWTMVAFNPDSPGCVALRDLERVDV